MARIDTLGNFLTDVASAIKEKKGDSTNIAAEDFDTEIENLPSGGGKYATRFISFAYYEGTNLDYELANLDISNLTSMKRMFSGNSNLLSSNINNYINNWDTSKITNMQNMFSYDTSLVSLDLSNWDTSSVTNFGCMFDNCTSLTTLDLSGFDISNASGTVTTYGISNMFNKCTSLTTLDISNFEFTSLASSIAKDAVFGNNSNNGPADNCLIYVKNQAQVDWLAIYYPRLTNVQIKS